MTPSPFFVYLIKCNDNSFYTGLTSRSSERFAEHLTDKNNNTAQFLKRKGKKPFKMFIVREFHSYDSAHKFELWLKKQNKGRKENLIWKMGLKKVIG